MSRLSRSSGRCAAVPCYSCCYRFAHSERPRWRPRALRSPRCGPALRVCTRSTAGRRSKSRCAAAPAGGRPIRIDRARRRRHAQPGHRRPVSPDRGHAGTIGVANAVRQVRPGGRRAAGRPEIAGSADCRARIRTRDRRAFGRHGFGARADRDGRPADSARRAERPGRRGPAAHRRGAAGRREPVAHALVRLRRGRLPGAVDQPGGYLPAVERCSAGGPRPVGAARRPDRAVRGSRGQRDSGGRCAAFAFCARAVRAADPAAQHERDRELRRGGGSAGPTGHHRRGRLPPGGAETGRCARPHRRLRGKSPVRSAAGDPRRTVLAKSCSWLSISTGRR